VRAPRTEARFAAPSQTGRLGACRSEPTEAPVAGGRHTPSPRATVSAKRTAALFSLNEAIVLPVSVDTRHVFAGPGVTRYTVPSLCLRILIRSASRERWSKIRAQMAQAR